MRLIDADRIDRNVVKVYDYKDQKWVNIFDIPTVDAKLVVRCKDCRWGRKYDEDLIECPLDLNNPPEYNPYDWYCPNGTRRE